MAGNIEITTKDEKVMITLKVNNWAIVHCSKGRSKFYLCYHPFNEQIYQELKKYESSGRFTMRIV
ncbi:MAG: hypothetical protein QW156_03940 [Candidatus Aenigmatarchaeota archaeon]